MADYGSNAANMNVAERLAQRLKESDMGSLLDEDSVTEIAQDAIKRAFFKDRPQGGYNGTILPPLAVELATATFKTAISEAIAPVVADLIADDDFKILIRQSVVNSIPEAARQIAQGIVSASVIQSSDVIMTRLQSTVGAKLGIGV